MNKIIKYMLFLCMLLGQTVAWAKVYDTLDYYKTLEVATDAATDEIKSAYHRLALLWHPDKNSSKEAQEKFPLIANAYAVLSDAKLRALYDATVPEETTVPRRKSHRGSSDQETSNEASRSAFKGWVAQFKQSMAERNKTKIVVCGAIVSYLTLIGFLKIVQLCIKENKTFSLGNFEIYVPKRGNASLGKNGFCGFSFPVPL